ncbi:protein valois [Toxorhynchites rutilus septentrionalis]|uniref:protein valois n=1 Tax=Toxorhynchites rutilus septentrionalis TaxID=329112 RepID=UPI002478D3A9|nr:protein valois [Toxorhynchites rutilus septentrionalis]
MDYIKRMNMIEMFQEPPEYRPPGTEQELAISVDYPNLNSLQYRMTRKPSQNVLHPFLDHIACNCNGQTIVVGNDYTGRRWGSSFYGWENVEDVMVFPKAIFKRQCQYSITALKFTKDPNLFFIGNDKGSIELWSIRNATRGEGYSLYQIDARSEHIEGVSALDIFEEEENKLVTGSNDGCIKVWNYGADLQSITTMTLAHTDEITGLSTNREEESVFVSSSLDRSSLVWDLRQPRPASALFEGHKYAFTTVYWSTKKEANRVVALGDAAGGVHFVDVRQPNVFLNSVQAFNKKIHKISFNGTMFAVLGDTNSVKIYDEMLSLLQECKPTSNYIRDLIWDGSGSDKQVAVCMVGWDLFFKRLEM